MPASSLLLSVSLNSSRREIQDAKQNLSLHPRKVNFLEPESWVKSCLSSLRLCVTFRQ